MMQLPMRPRRSHRLCPIAIVGLAAALTGSCSTTPAPIALDNSVGGRVVAVVTGQEADLTLQTLGPGQYGAPTLSSSSVTFEGMSFSPLQNPGGPRQVYRFRAVASGTSDISIPHVGDVNPTPPFIFTFVVD